MAGRGRPKPKVPKGWITLSDAARSIDVERWRLVNLVNKGELEHKKADDERTIIIRESVLSEIEAKYGGESGGREIEAEGEAVEVPDDVMQVLAQLEGAAASCHISRKDPAGKWRFLVEVPASEFSIAGLQRVYGGGDYQVKILDGTKNYLKAKVFAVEGPPRFPSAEPEAERAQDDSTNSLLVMMMREVLAELRQRNEQTGQNPMQMAMEMAKVMQESSRQAIEAFGLTRGGGNADAAELFEIFERGMSLGRTLSEGGDDTMMKLGGQVLGMIEDERKKKETAPAAVTPGQEQPAAAAAPVDLLRPWIPTLMQLAQRGKSVELYVDVTLDQMPDAMIEILTQQLARGEAFDTEVYQAFPEIGNYKVWFDAFLARLREALGSPVYDAEIIEAADVTDGAVPVEADKDRAIEHEA